MHEDAKLRRKVWKAKFADSEVGACCYCGEQLLYEDATLEHIIARTNGGTNDFENLDIACEPCNSTKGHTEDRFGVFKLTQKELCLRIKRKRKLL